MFSVFSSKGNDHHAWNNCSFVLPIFEYCCLKWFGKPCQSMLIGLKDSNHSLASVTNVRQNLWTFTPSWNWCVSIQSLVQSKCVFLSSGIPENFGLKCDQFNCSICCACCVGCCGAGGSGGAGTAGACGPAFATFILHYAHYSYFIFLFYLYSYFIFSVIALG